MNERMRFRFSTVEILTLCTVCSIVGCGSEGAAASGGLPRDKQVVADVMPSNKDGLIAVSVTKRKRSEPYLHQNDLNWYWDRGVTVERRANISGAPDAVVVIGGLARYHLVSDRYEYLKFLVTYNEYEGIPAPDEGELVDYVRDNLAKVFVSRDHRIVEIGSLQLDGDAAWQWHSATSFSVPFTIGYKHITNDTTVEAREDGFELRFYRDSIDSPLSNLLATERSRKQLGTEQYTADQIQGMKTLRTGL